MTQDRKARGREGWLSPADHASRQSVFRAPKIRVVDQRRKETKGSEIGVVESIKEVCLELEKGRFVQMEEGR